MPQIDSISIKNGKIYIWKITESKKELLNIYDNRLPKDYFRYKILSHQRQFIAKQILFQRLGIEKLVYKTPEGKPLLGRENEISVSHTDKYVAVAISICPVGIDVEKQSKKIVSIAPKFIHEDCSFLSQKSENELYQIIWSVKESIYKLLNIKGLSFSNDIIIQSIDQKRKKGTAIIQRKKVISFCYRKLDAEHNIVWTT